jgi:uncharacterized YccA/Bax inhibitor family protein
MGIDIMFLTIGAFMSQLLFRYKGKGAKQTEGLRTVVAFCFAGLAFWGFVHFVKSFFIAT